MPFHPGPDDADTIERVREELQRAADRFTRRLPVKAGDRVKLLRELPPELQPYQGELGIVTGCMGGTPPQASVVIPLNTGNEMEITMLASDLEKVDG